MMENKGTGTVYMAEQVEYPITVTTATGTVVTVHATRETIEGFYGNVNKMVDNFIKPLKDVTSIVVQAYDPFFDEVLPVTTYDAELEMWCASESKIEIAYDFYGTGTEDYEHGYLEVQDGWLPRYAMRYEKNDAQSYPICTTDLKRIEVVAQKALPWLEVYVNLAKHLPSVKTPITAANSL